VDLDLHDARVLVTGGAGGIGAAICRLLGAEGARVAVHVGRSRAAGEQLADEIGGVCVAGDVRVPEQVEDAVAAAAAAFDGLDAIVVNAGVWPPDDVPLWELPVERWREVVNVDLTGAFLTLRAFGRHLATRGEYPRPPAVVLVGSTAGTFGEAGHGAYAAAKAGLQIGLLRTLKNELVALHPRARANAVAPGWTRTVMTADGLSDERVAAVTSTWSLAEVGEVDDVAHAVVWLLSDRAAGHVTGEVIHVAGGMEGRRQR
jgi:3-oxoacyl-[acyl-carrier protein] reductase